MFDPLDFFALAKRLVGECGSSECAFRTGIGRAYYAAHLYARTKIPAGAWIGLPSKSDEHWFVRHIMKKRSHPEIADKLETLATMRKTSDYDLSTTVGQPELDAAILLTDNLLQLIEKV